MVPLLQSQPEFWSIKKPIEIKLLALTKDSKADFLITGVNDLLLIKKFEQSEILSYAEIEIKIK